MTEQEAIARFHRMDEAALGRFGEALWSRIFAASGIQYIPLARIETGGAPMAEGKERIILPDFDCAYQGNAAFVDSKAKRQSIIYRLKQQERHGINRNAYQAYVKAGVTWRKNTGLALVELYRDGMAWSGTLFAETFRNLGEPYSEHAERPPKVYWRRKQFVDLDSLSAAELIQVAMGQIVKSYEYELDRIFFFKPLKQKELI